MLIVERGNAAMTKQEKMFMREGNRYGRLADQAERRGDLDLAIKMNKRAQAAYTAAEQVGAAFDRAA